MKCLHRHALLIFAGLLALTSFAQQPDDSTGRSDSAPAREGAAQLRHLLQTAEGLINTNPTVGLIWADSAAALCRALNLEEWEPAVLHSQSTLSWAAANHGRAALYARQLLELGIQRRDSVTIANGEMMLGTINGTLGNYVQALQHMLATLKLAEQMGKQSNALYNNIGTTYILMKDTTSGLHYYKLGLAQALKDSSADGAALLHCNLATMHQARNEADSSLVHAELALNIAQKTGNISTEISALVLLGTIDQKQKLFDEARIHYTRALELARTLSVDNELTAYHHLADLSREEQKAEAAEHYYTLALSLADSLGLKLQQHDVHQDMATFYTENGQAALSSHHWKLAAALKDSLYSDQLASKANDMRARYEIDKSVQENRLLKQEQMLQQSRIKRQNLFMILTSLSVLLLVAGLWQYRRSNRAILNAKLALEEANSAKDRFFSIIAHDLRNPFQTLTSFIRLMERHVHSYTPEEINELTASLKENVNNTACLLENLLEWSQSQTGTLPFAPHLMNLTPLIDRVMRQAFGMAHSKSVLLTNGLEDPILIYADRNMLEATLRNLVSNAIKYTNKGGEVRITAVYNDGFVEITVQDTGVGMTRDIVENLFEIGQRVSTKGTNSEPGTGLGLILAKEFMNLHGGRIEVNSTPKQGSTFTILLPAQKREKRERSK